jgi:hypothetical protein
MSSKFFTNQGTDRLDTKIYKKLSDKTHNVAYHVNFIDTVDIVKTIEGK